MRWQGAQTSHRDAHCASLHCGPADQGYRWSNLWSLDEISIIAEELGIALSDLHKLETWWRPVPMNAMLGLVLPDEMGRQAHVDLGYQVEIDGRTAIVWSEEFGEVIRAQWVLSVAADSEIATPENLELSDGCDEVLRTEDQEVRSVGRWMALACPLAAHNGSELPRVVQQTCCNPMSITV